MDDFSSARPNTEEGASQGAQSCQTYVSSRFAFRVTASWGAQSHNTVVSNCFVFRITASWGAQSHNAVVSSRFGVQAGMHEPQVVLDIQCEWGCGAHRNRTLPWDIVLFFQCLLVLEAIPVRAVGGHLRPIQRGFASPGGTTAKATWLRFSTVACIHHGVTFSNVLCHVVQHYAQGHRRITKEATSYIICKPQVASLHSIVWLCYDHGAILDILGRGIDERIQDVRFYFPSSLIGVCTSRAQENCTGLGTAILKYHQGRNTGGCMDGCAADLSAGCGTPL